MKSLEEMQREVLEFCRSKGWYDKQVTFGESVALLHSEASEALEAYRSWGLQDKTPEACQLSRRGEACAHNHKPEGVGSEFADVFIRLLDDCERWGIDLRAEYERKMAYNMNRPYRHGRLHY